MYLCRMKWKFNNKSAELYLELKERKMGTSHFKYPYSYSKFLTFQI